MRIVNRNPVLFYLAIISFSISSAAIALMPLGNIYLSERSTIAAALAGAFWVGLIAGIILLQIVAKRRRWDKKFECRGSFIRHFFMFFSNKPAVVFDVLLIAGVLGYAAVTIYPDLPRWLGREAIFLIILSLEMHCIFTGKNYKWVRFCADLRKG